MNFRIFITINRSKFLFKSIMKIKKSIQTSPILIKQLLALSSSSIPEFLSALTLHSVVASLVMLNIETRCFSPSAAHVTIPSQSSRTFRVTFTEYVPGVSFSSQDFFLRSNWIARNYMHRLRFVTVHWRVLRNDQHRQPRKTLSLLMLPTRNNQSEAEWLDANVKLWSCLLSHSISAKHGSGLLLEGFSSWANVITTTVKIPSNIG